jgi:hypothetical protein
MYRHRIRSPPRLSNRVFTPSFLQNRLKGPMRWFCDVVLPRRTQRWTEMLIQRRWQLGPVGRWVRSISFSFPVLLQGKTLPVAGLPDETS